MKHGIVLCLVIATLSLAACSTHIIQPECAWAEPIEFSETTKEWLRGQDWPDAAYEDFKKIGDHNELFRENCRGASHALRQRG